MRKCVSDYKWLFAGFFLCEFSSSLSLFIGFSTYLRMLGVIIIFISFFKIERFKLSTYKPVYSLLIFFTFFILIRGSLIGNDYVLYETNQRVHGLYSVIRHFILYPHSGLAFLIPLVFLLKFDLKELFTIKRLSLICVFLSFILLYYFYSQISNADAGNVELEGDEDMRLSTLMNMLCVGFGAILFMSLCFKYLKGLVYWLIPLFVLFYFVINIIAGSRGGTVSSLLYIIIFVFFYFKYARDTRQRRIVSWLMIAIVVFAFVKIFNYLYDNSYFDYFLYKVEKGETLEENNRTVFVKALVQDFNSDPLSWLWGRGINGAYRVSGSIRTSMEWGWLWYILKGGILYLATYVFILLRTFYIGFFKSKNVLCKAFGVFALLQVYSLIPFGLPAVNLWNLIVWIGVGFINYAPNLTLSDNEIQLFFEKK